MKLGKGMKVLVGLLTLWMPLYFIGFMVFVLSMIVVAASQQGEKGLPVAFGILAVLHLFTLLLSIALAVFYIVHVVKNPRIQQTNRVVWVIVLLFGGVIAMPIYWYLHIWPEPVEPSPGGGPGASAG
jgi:hypothetical protein